MFESTRSDEGFAIKGSHLNLEDALSALGSFDIEDRLRKINSQLIVESSNPQGIAEDLLREYVQTISESDNSEGRFVRSNTIQSIGDLLPFVSPEFKAELERDLFTKLAELINPEFSEADKHVIALAHLAEERGYSDVLKEVLTDYPSKRISSTGVGLFDHREAEQRCRDYSTVMEILGTESQEQLLRDFRKACSREEKGNSLEESHQYDRMYRENYFTPERLVRVSRNPEFYEYCAAKVEQILTASGPANRNGARSCIVSEQDARWLVEVIPYLADKFTMLVDSPLVRVAIVKFAESERFLIGENPVPFINNMLNGTRERTLEHILPTLLKKYVGYEDDRVSRDFSLLAELANITGIEEVIAEAYSQIEPDFLASITEAASRSAIDDVLNCANQRKVLEDLVAEVTRRPTYF